MTGFHDQAWVTVAGALCFGMLLSLMGASRRALVGWFQLMPDQAAGLLSVFALALIPASVVGGLLVDAWSAKHVLCLGSALASGAFVVLLSNGSRSYRGCLSAMILAGAGGGLLNCGTVVLMPKAFFENNPVASTNLGFLFVGLGAVVTPLLADLLLKVQGTGYRRTLGTFALLCLAPIMVGLVKPSNGQAAEPAGIHLDIFWRSSLWTISGVFVFYGVLEGWLSRSALPYLKRSGFTEATAGLLLVLTWTAFLGMRFVVAYWQQTGVLDPESDHFLMMGLALILTVALGNLAGAHRHDAIVLWMLLVGACLGPIFSSLVGFLFLNYEPQEYGTAYGAMFAIGTASSLLLAPLYSPRSEQTAPDKTATDKSMLYLLAGVGLLLIAAILTAWVTR